MDEFIKLEEWLIENRYPYERVVDKKPLSPSWFYNQLIVFYENGDIAFDVIWCLGSYGWEDGLLEIYGDIVDIPVDGDSVVGWLSANDVIERINKWAVDPM